MIEQEQEQLDTFLPSRSTGSFGTSSATGIRGSQALLEAAVSSAIQHPCIVETYDYQLVDLQSGNGSDPLSALTGTMVRLASTALLDNTSLRPSLTTSMHDTRPRAAPFIICCIGLPQRP